MIAHISNKYVPMPVLFRIEDERDGISAIFLHEPGPVFQMVTDKLLSQMDVYEKAVWDYHFRSLKRRDASIRCEWWMKCGKRYLGHWALWQLSSAQEWVEIHFLEGIIRVAERFRKEPPFCNMFLTWGTVLRYVVKGQ